MRYLLKSSIQLIVIFLLFFIVSGCGVELLTTTAIQGELQAKQLKSMQRQVQSISNQTGKINIERAIQTFQAENGRYPTSLAELVPQFLPSLPQPSNDKAYSFDPATGQIITVPAAIPTEDIRKMEQIKYAVVQFARTTGYYPANLDSLYPSYLTFVPRTNDGGPFIYNPQTGAVLHPLQSTGTNVHTNPGNSTPSGASPMPYTTGGMGIQQQLNGMPNSSGAVGSHSRENLQGIQNDYSNKQNKIMDDLGL